MRHRYRDSINCLREVALQIESVLHRKVGSLPDAQLSRAQQKFRQDVIRSSDDLLTHSRRILRQMRDLAEGS